jgi:hypothetical protein
MSWFLFRFYLGKITKNPELESLSFFILMMLIPFGNLLLPLLYIWFEYDFEKFKINYKQFFRLYDNDNQKK